MSVLEAFVTVCKACGVQQLAYWVSCIALWVGGNIGPSLALPLLPSVSPPALDQPFPCCVPLSPPPSIFLSVLMLLVWTCLLA